MTPASYTPPLTWESFLCVGCGPRDAADIIVNWILFLPGGALMALAFGRRRAVVTAIYLTALVETLQIGIPGRDPALQDLLFNTLGALSGVHLVHRGLGKRSQRALAALAVLAWLAPIALLIPRTSSADLYGQWTPAFANLEQYDGKIVAASVGGTSVRSTILTDRGSIHRAILGRLPIELSLEVGSPPSSFAPVFQVVDAERVALVTVGASGEDLIVQGNNQASLLRLDQPGVRWRGAMRGVSEGDTATVVIERGRGSMCMSVGARTRCGLAPSLGNGWGHLASLGRAPAWLTMLASLLWCGGLGLMLGATASKLPGALLRGVGLAAVGLLGCRLSPDVRPDVLHATLLAAGSLLGHSLRSLGRPDWIKTLAEVRR